MTALFISDLHLHASRPRATRCFLELLRGRAAAADSLYILGDLFEAWIGDDDPEPHYREVRHALRTLTDGGTRCLFAHGNRDFLVGRRFSEETGVELLDDATVVVIGGKRILLMHGDSLCTDDVAYQRLRRVTRNPLARWLMRRIPLQRRLRIAGYARERSKAAQAQLAPEIMDVNAEAVARAMRRHDARTLVHGHTHRPGIHEFELDGAPARRIVLGDWYRAGSLLEWSPGAEPRLESLPWPGDAAGTG